MFLFLNFITSIRKLLYFTNGKKWTFNFVFWKLIQLFWKFLHKNMIVFGIYAQKTKYVVFLEEEKNVFFKLDQF